MQSLEILKQELITQKELLDSKGFPVNVKSVNPSPSEITEAIENINLDFSQTTSEESDVILGKTFYSKDTTLKTGTLVIPDVESATATEDTVLKGKTFYAGNTELKTGTVVIPDLSETTATESDVLEGKEFFNASGEKVTGTHVDMLQERINGSPEFSYMFFHYKGDNIDFLKNLDTQNITSMAYMFYYAEVDDLRFPELNTSNVTTMRNMFEHVKAKSLNIDNLDTQNVTTMEHMFYVFTGVDTFVFPNIDISKVTTMSNMFTSSGFKSLDLSHLNTQNVTNMSAMFSSNNYLEEVIMGGLFDTSKVSNMNSMFNSCKALVSEIELNAEKSSTLESAFYACSKIPKVTLRNTGGVQNFNRIFYACGSLTTVETLDMRSYDPNRGQQIFNSCTNLTNLKLKNLRKNITIGSGTSWGHLLTLESLTNAIQELWTNTSTSTLRLGIGTANIAKLEDIYVKLIPITDEMRAEDEYIDNKAPFVQCESTDEGAMLITEYVTTVKNWQLA